MTLGEDSVQYRKLLEAFFIGKIILTYWPPESFGSTFPRYFLYFFLTIIVHSNLKKAKSSVG